MNKLVLDIETVLKRVNGIQGELKELEQLGKIPFVEFKDGVGFKLAQFHLHRALEGIFHISTHILSRIPGAQATEYKEIAKNLGKYGIVPENYADITLIKMAGYRNRLVHFYAEVTPEELLEIINKHLKDFDVFLKSIKKILKNPSKFGL
jgi:uncharacterized protein YutE (UPF0331/DUF86 family)